MAFNLIDVLLIAIVLLSMLNGYGRGFVLGIRDLAAWALSLIAALRFYQPLAGWIQALAPSLAPSWNRPIAFLLITIAVMVLVHLIAHAIFRHLPRDTHEQPVNRILGIFPGFVNGIITAAIVSALLLTVPFSEGLRDRAAASPSVNRLAVYTEELEAALHPVFGEAIAQTLNLLTVKPESNERVALSFKVAAPKARPDLEARMLELVNQERAAAGLRPLAPDPELTESLAGIQSTCSRAATSRM